MASIPPMQWSKAMEDLYREYVLRKVQYDKRTDWDDSISLGFPSHIIFEEVLAKGRADFTTSHDDDEYGSLTTDDKVLLYCFLLMRRHFYEALATFRAYKTILKSMFDSPRSTIMMDLGCGPGTAGLALCECFERPQVVYYGLDIAPSMRSKARSLLRAAKEASLLDAKSKIATTSSWTHLKKVPGAIGKPINVVFNATYLFSSDSLNVNDVCDTVLAVKQSPHVGRLVFVYSNTTTEISGEKFRAFKKLLKDEFTAGDQIKCERTYHKWRMSNATQRVEFVRQLLEFKDAQ